jgi:hypothetical protein
MEDKQEPQLVQINNGWQAHGDGWAVYGATREEAIENYWKAVQRHKEILALPPWYIQVKAQSTSEERYA